MPKTFFFEISGFFGSHLPFAAAREAGRASLAGTEVASGAGAEGTKDDMAELYGPPPARGDGKMSSPCETQIARSARHRARRGVCFNATAWMLPAGATSAASHRGRDVRQQAHVARPLDGAGEHALLHGRRAGPAAGLDLAVAAHHLAQRFGV